jgi:glycosyltransferase involved in cell wall biosynthesis
VTRYAILGSYPPSRGGIASFTASLATALVEAGGPPAQIVRVVDTAEDRPVVPWRTRTVISGELIGDDPESIPAAVARLNAADVAIVQHDFDIYAGPDGEAVVAVLESVAVPTIIVLHTVPQSPTDAQRAILTSVARLASTIVVMTEAAHELLASRYGIAREHVHVIPYGSAEPFTPRKPLASHANARPRVLTWGLIGPGSGIEWGIEAMAIVTRTVSDAEYIVTGAAHPRVPVDVAETYWTGLRASISRLKLASSVRLDPRYLEPAELRTLIASADVVLLPYDSVDQMTSGVLVEAIAAGVPVVATGFPHAAELLAEGRGRLVQHRDPDSMAAAIREVLRPPTLWSTPLPVQSVTTWRESADQFRALARQLRAAAAA